MVTQSTKLIALFTALAIATPAFADDADDRVLPSGTLLKLPGSLVERELAGEWILVTRAELDDANADSAIRERLENALLVCSARVAKIEGKSKSSAWTKVKWVTVGLAIGGAFAAGVYLGAR